MAIATEPNYDSLMPPEILVSLDERKKLAKKAEEITTETLEQLEGVIGKAVYVTATATHRFYYHGKNNDQIADVFVDGMKEEINGEPAIIVGAVSNIVFFRLQRAIDEEPLQVGAWLQNFQAVLAEESETIEEATGVA